jgi:ribose transport system substrate-binding protein
MSHLKKVAVGAVTLTAALALTACGSSGSASSDGSSGSDKTYRIGVSFYNQALPMYTQMLQGLQSEAKAKGVKLIVTDANNSAQTQTNQLNDLVTQGVDAIIAAPQDAQALIPAYKSVQAADIPIFSSGTNIADATAETGYVGPSLANEATDAMQSAITAIGGSGDVLLVTGPPTSGLVIQQHAGLKAAFAKAPGIKVVNTIVVPDLSKAATVDPVTAALTTDPDIKAIFASNDQIALGIVQAMQSLNKPAGSIYIASFNTPPEVVTALKANQIQAAVSQKAVTWGNIALDTVYDKLTGTKVAALTPTKYLLVTSKTVNTLTDTDLN